MTTTYKLTMRIGALQLRRLVDAHNLPHAIEIAGDIGVSPTNIKAVHVASDAQRQRYKYLSAEDLLHKPKRPKRRPNMHNT